MIRKKANCDLALPMRLMVDGRSDCALFEIWRHFEEEVARNQPHFSFKVPSPESAADRQAIDCIDIYPSEIGNAPQQIDSSLEALVFVFVIFNDGYSFAAKAVFRESLRKTSRLLPVVFRHQRTRHYCHFRPWWNKLPKQLAGHTPAQIRSRSEEHTSELQSLRHLV